MFSFWKKSISTLALIIVASFGLVFANDLEDAGKDLGTSSQGTVAERGNTVHINPNLSSPLNSLFDRILGGGSSRSYDGYDGPVRVSTPSSYQLNYDGPVFDGPGLVGGAQEVEGRIDTNISRERNLKELIIGWTNFLLSVAAIMAVVALVWAGFLYITAFGDDSRMETAKKIVIWVILGILLILAAYAIVNTVMRAVF